MKKKKGASREKVAFGDKTPKAMSATADVAGSFQEGGGGATWMIGNSRPQKREKDIRFKL